MCFYNEFIMYVIVEHEIYHYLNCIYYVIPTHDVSNDMLIMYIIVELEIRYYLKFINS